ncbi:unnamed protein product [Phytophthora lilii]|uniref:Unnamed protein product n=1 Tax=Phytophthora lilii TaxID=2077276 RepID=A0A9W6X6D3_9STRA|nr:unnamed protein product [Phytophthora lilii]
MDAAMRMQRAGQTTHPKYAQIVALLRQYHHQRNGSATAGGGGGGGATAGNAAASQQRQRQLQLQQQLHQQQQAAAAGQAGRGVSTLQHQAQRLQQQQQAQRLQYQRQLQLQAQATAMASAPAPLDVAAHPFMQAKQAGSTQTQTPGQQLAAVQRNPVAQMLFSDKQLEYLHNQIRAYKALCHSMDEAMAQTKQTATGSSSGGLAPASAPSPPPSRPGSAKSGNASHEQPQQLMTKSSPLLPAPVAETADRKPKWTRASRNLLFLGPECFDGDLIDIAAKGHAAFGPYNLSSPWLGLSDVALKQRYLHALHAFLSSSLEAREPRGGAVEGGGAHAAGLALRAAPAATAHARVSQLRTPLGTAWRAPSGGPQVVPSPATRVACGAVQRGEGEAQEVGGDGEEAARGPPAVPEPLA